MKPIRAVLAAAALAALLSGCTDTSGVPVTDEGTGVQAVLPGTPVRETQPVVGADGAEAQGVAFRAQDPSGRAEVVVRISPLPVERRYSPDLSARMTAHLLDGTLTHSRPATVGGHDGVDARIDGWRRHAGTGVLVVRIVGAPAYEVTVETSGDAADAALVEQVAGQVGASLRLP